MVRPRSRQQRVRVWRQHVGVIAATRQEVLRRLRRDPCAGQALQVLRSRRQQLGVRDVTRAHASLEDRFWRYVATSDGCWEWIGFKNRKGYGKIGLGRRDQGTILAHRLSWILAHKKRTRAIPKGMHVCHRCDNPGCVRPSHLFLGTDADNLADMRAKGRGKLPPVLRGEAHGFTTLTEKQVRAIRTLVKKGLYYRQVAKKFHVSKSTISNIVRRQTWSHLS